MKKLVLILMAASAFSLSACATDGWDHHGKKDGHHDRDHGGDHDNNNDHDHH